DVARSYLNALQADRALKREALRDICFSAAVKRSHHEFRLALVAGSKSELVDELEVFLRGESRFNFSTARKSEELSRPIFVCSGMGQQWWAMGRELLEQEPVFRRVVEEVNDLLSQLSGWSLLDKLRADEKASLIQTDPFRSTRDFRRAGRIGRTVAVMGYRTCGCCGP